MWTVDDENHDSPVSGEEASNDGNITRSGDLKKGPWSQEEDAILAEYVTTHGEGNWNAVAKFSGLSRCGKSCRLRWANHLRPDLKKGEFTSEEEEIVVRLKAKLGNKWAKIAAEIPGRTDNDIKNFWNTRIKRLQRKGIQIYPDNVLCLKKSSESQQTQGSGIFSDEMHSSHNVTVTDMLGFGVPSFKRKHPQNYSSKFLGSPTNRNMLPQDNISSRYIDYSAPNMRSQKRLRESTASLGLSDTATSSFSSKQNSNAFFQHHQPYDLPPLSGFNFLDDLSLCGFPGSHACINGTHSTFNPIFGPGELELPSFQNSDSNYSFWDSPPFMCNDTLIHPPQATGPSQLQGTPDTDGLLESIVWPVKKANTSKVETNQVSWDDVFINIFDPVPPMDPLAAIFTDRTITGFPTVEMQQTNDIHSPHAKTPDTDLKTAPTCTSRSNLNSNEDSYPLDSLPISWLASNVLSSDTELGKDILPIQETLSALKDGTNKKQQL